MRQVARSANAVRLHVVLATSLALSCAMLEDTRAADASQDLPDARDAELARAHALLPAAEWAAIRKVIEEQRDALRSGDGARAFAYASPTIRERFHDAPTFLAMVRESYAALLDARRAEFLDGAVVEGRTLQPLRLVMQDDKVLVAVYEMRQDDTGRWRIAGCVIAPSTVRST